MPDASQGSVAVVADDHGLFRIALASILTGHLGFSRVIETGSLDEALERLAETEGVTLALFDLAMPGMSDATSLAAVRECYPMVKTVVVSGSTRRQDVLLALQAGVHGYVCKAVAVDELTDALRTVLTGRVYVPAFITEIEQSGSGEAPARADGEPLAAVEVLDAIDAGLTPRQREVLELLVRGASNKEIARALNLGPGTVKVHVAALFRALGVRNRSSAVATGVRMFGRD